MIFGKCSIKVHTQFIIIEQENYVLGTFCNIFAIDLLRKSILQLVITQHMEFGIKLSCELEIVITFE